MYLFHTKKMPIIVCQKNIIMIMSFLEVFKRLLNYRLTSMLSVYISVIDLLVVNLSCLWVNYM